LTLKTPLTIVATTDTHKPERLLRPAVVADRLGISLPTLWRMRRRGDFPEPIKITAATVGYIERDVDAWIEARAAKRL